MAQQERHALPASRPGGSSAAWFAEQAIVLKYQNESRRQYELYVQKKQLLDLKLHEEETRQTAPESLQTLLETYLKAVDTLLSAYVADMKSVLSL